MNKRYSLLFFIALAPLWAWAQAVEGTVCDSLNASPEPYATIQLFTAEGARTKALKVTSSDADGRFTLPVPVAGDYVVRISAIGRAPWEKSVEVKGKETLSLGRVLLQDAEGAQLGEVAVTAQRLLVKNEIDKISYNMAEDPDAQSNSLLEMLRKVPMVTVDGEDNIQVNGNSSFKVYVNGKPSTMMSSNPSLILKNYPATAVQKVEVITMPGAKYDAEGVAGVLNIVTNTETKTSGYTLTPSLSWTNRGVMGSLFGLMQFGKFTLSLNSGVGQHKQPNTCQHLENENFTSPTHHYYSVDGTRPSKGFFSFGSLEASYEFDARNLLSLSAGLWGHKGKNDGVTTHTMLADDHTTQTYAYRALNYARARHFNFNASLDYQHTFRKPERTFTLSYRVAGGPEETRLHTEYVNLEGDVPPSLYDQRTEPNQRSAEHTVQTDFTLPFGAEGKGGKLSVGAKYIYRFAKSDNDVYLRPAQKNEELGVRGEEWPFGSYLCASATLPTPDFLLSAERSTRFHHNGHIGAAYAEYQVAIKKFSLLAGARYEYYKVAASYPDGRHDSFHAQISDLVPSLTLGYQITPSQMLKVGYNLRIGRPDITSLSPYSEWERAEMVTYGNPELTSERGHNFTASYSTFSRKFSLNATLTYQLTNNGLTNYNYLDTERYATPVFVTTYCDALHRRNVSLNVFANWSITPTTSLNINATGQYSDLSAHYGDVLHNKNHGFQASCFGGLRQTIAKRWQVGAWLGGRTPEVALQGRSGSFFFYNLSLSRTFLKDDRLTVALQADNFLTRHRRFSHSITTVTYRESNYMEIDLMRLGVSVRYRLGTLRTQVKKTARTISNDDKISTGSSETQGENGGSGY